MLARIRAVSIVGLDAFEVEVETDLRPALPKVVIVGLPDASLKESQERVESAIKNSDLEWPSAKIVVNLAPADLRKEGTAFDLPIALAVLCSNGQCDPAPLGKYLIAGELSLDGSLRPVHGVLPMALKARELGLGVIVPAQNAAEAAVVSSVEVIPASHLGELTSWARGYTEIAAQPHRGIGELLRNTPLDADFLDVKGQEHAKRALEVAAAGGHNLLMVGPPGSGKTMLAKRVPGILPDLTEDEALAVTRIYSVAGLVDNDVGLVTTRPFRAPHHTASIPGVIGGGTIPRPGEISLAHCGVLFLDEMPEMPRTLLETLRQPLEDGEVTISRANLTLTFPSRFMLIGSMNPCPCGYYGDMQHKCTCSAGQILSYRQRLSGPLLDRIDMTLEVARLPVAKLTRDEEAPGGEASTAIKARVMAARARQYARNLPVAKARDEGRGMRDELNETGRPDFSPAQPVEAHGCAPMDADTTPPDTAEAVVPPMAGAVPPDSPGGAGPRARDEGAQSHLEDYAPLEKGSGNREEGSETVAQAPPLASGSAAVPAASEGDEGRGMRDELNETGRPDFSPAQPVGAHGCAPMDADTTRPDTAEAVVPPMAGPLPPDLPGGAGRGAREHYAPVTNAALSSKQVRAYCKLDDACQALLTRAVERLGLSARAYERIRKVARTIADLDGSEHIQVPHLAEAIQYRSGEERLRG